MATRSISTRLAVEGESQYRAAITSVNAELRTMQSALKMVESQYKNNSNSTEALTAKGKALNDLLTSQKSKVSALEAGLKNAQRAEDEYARKKAELTQQIEENTKALEELKKQSGDTSSEEKKLTEENERLNAELEKNEAYLTAAKRATNNWKTDLNTAQTAINETQNAIDENTAALEKNAGGLKKDGEAFDMLAATLIASGLKKSIKEITEALMECVDASVEFESSMAGVAKTTDLADAELQSMGGEIKDLSTKIPITSTELAGIVEAAGQLGIAKEDLIDFSTVMANLGVATNLTSEEAATMLARFANVTKMDPSNYENLGSVIVALGNNMATTESDIVTMGQRLSAAGTLAGLTEQEIMALAASMSSVGIEAEAGGSSMSQTLNVIEKAVANGGDAVAKFAEIAGMSADEFSAKWESKPIDAIQAFITGLGNLDEKGESAVLALDELGLTGIRQSNMLKSLGLASDVLADSVKLANTAWAENTALATEAATRYETTESKITMFKNSVTNLEIAVGDQLTPALGELADTGMDVTEWATDLVQENEWLVPTITAVSAALATVTAVLGGTIVVVKVIIPLISKLNGTLLANPYFLVATAIAGVVAALITLAVTLPSATEEADKLNDSMEDTAKAFEDAENTYKNTSKNIEATAQTLDAYIDRLDELEGQSSMTSEEQAEYNRLVGEVARLLPEANTKIDETTGRLEAGADALRANVDEWRNMAQAAAESARIQAMTQGLTDAYVALYTAQDELTVMQSSASEQTLAYASSLQELTAAQEAYKEAQKGGDYYEIEAAYAAIEDAQNKVIDSAKGLTGEQKEAGQAIASLRDEVTDAEEGVASYEAKIKTLQESMTETGDAAGNVAEGISDASDALEKAGEVSGEGIKEGFDTGIAGMSDSAAIEMADTQAIVADASEDVVATATDMGSRSAEGFDSEVGGMVDSAKQAMSDVNQTVQSSATDAYNSGYDVGAAISRGAAAGVMAYARRVAEEAAKMVRDAIDAANREADIHSPSKETMKTGRFLDEGLIAGIKQLENDVVSAMEGTMAKVVSVQVDVPEIPDHTADVLDAINGRGQKSDNIADAISKLGNVKREPPSIYVEQKIYADDTSYAGQQREATRRLKELARELGS